MKITAVFLLAAALPLQGQFFSASTSLLQSGIIHGTERERHFSMRMQAIGVDFSGYVADEITDLYRNPALLHRIERMALFGELVRQQQIARRLPIADARALVLSSSIPLGQIGEGKNLGVLLRGNYATSPLHTSEVEGYVNSYQAASTDRIDRDNWAEAQVMWSFPISGKFSATRFLAGVSYTYGINDSRNGLRESESNYLSESFFSGNTITEEERFSYDRDDDHTDKSHIFRLGLLWDRANDVSWDAIATLELFSAKPVLDLQQRQSLTENHSSPFFVYERFVEYDALQTAELKATNARLDLRYLNSAGEVKTFVAQLGGGLTFFSSEDRSEVLNSQRLYQAISSSTAEYSFSSRNTLSAAPGGFGFQVKGGLGWAFQQNNFLLAVAALGSYQRLKYDDVAHEEYTQLSVPNYIPRARSFPYEHAFSQYRLALPLGAECAITQRLHLRAGWVAQFRGETRKGGASAIEEESSIEAGNRYGSHRLDISTVTFGMGYQVFDQLRADFLNFGNISLPREWNMSVSYNF